MPNTETLYMSDNENDTALIVAVREGHWDVVQAILASPYCNAEVLNQQGNNGNTALQSKIIKFLENHAYPPLFEACNRERQSTSIAIIMVNSLRQLQQPTVEEIKSCVNSIASGSRKNPGGTFAGVLDKIYMMCEEAQSIEAQREEVASISPRMG